MLTLTLKPGEHVTIYDEDGLAIGKVHYRYSRQKKGRAIGFEFLPEFEIRRGAKDPGAEVGDYKEVNG